VTPERFRSPVFLEALPRLAVTRLAVDEAHCISQWGHDFRPDYWRLGEYRALCGDPPTVALTATATAAVALDIERALRLRDPLIVRAGIERPNLFLGATRLDRREDLPGVLVERIAAIDGPGVVYSTLIRDLEHLSDELRRVGVPNLVYHGKLSAQERRQMQERFMGSEREVVLATQAFGMGVDKADIRFVIHAQLPRTIEAWTQEVGRAGRDGAPAWCELFALEEDLAIQQRFVEWANPSREYLLGVYETLVAWGQRVQAKDLDDLRDELLVKNRHDQRVALCLRWLEVLGVTRGSFETHDLALVRPLEPDQLPELVGSAQKERADLEALLGLWRFATLGQPCRRARLAEHFSMPAPPLPCGACDACVPPAAWLSANLAPRPGADARGPSRGRAGEPDPARGWCRGDWVEVDGRHVGRVLRVEGQGRRVRLVVEDGTDLRQRSLDPRRVRRLR
jgi:ATP-dependent DNA helicase RecQ